MKKGGYFISYKSGNIEEELSRSENAVKILGGEIENTVYFQLPGSDIERSFVLIKRKRIHRENIRERLEYLPKSL